MRGAFETVGWRGGDGRDTARNTERAPFHLAHVGRLLEHQVGVVQQAIECGTREVGGGVLFQRGETGGIREQARMGGRCLTQRSGDGIKCRFGRALCEQRADGAGEEENEMDFASVSGDKHDGSL